MKKAISNYIFFLIVSISSFLIGGIVTKKLIEERLKKANANEYLIKKAIYNR
jgi:p-aminobenzoyl-glutamate transporter AbgT